MVCGDCNNGFSKIDKALAEQSMISMIRVVEQTTDADSIELAGTHFWTPPGGEETLEVQVGFRMKAKPKPQLMFSLDGDGKFQIRSCMESAEEYKIFLQVLKSWITSGKIDHLSTLTAPEDQPRYTLPRIVLHKGKDLFFRAPTAYPDPEGFLKNIVDFLRSHIDVLSSQLEASLKSAPVQSHPTPQIHVTAKISLNNTFRAIAKIAFNVLAAKESADFVLRSEFDPIRQ
jgi:hypothetical protein